LCAQQSAEVTSPSFRQRNVRIAQGVRYVELNALTSVAMGYTGAYSFQIRSTFRSNMSPPTSGKQESSLKQATRRAPLEEIGFSETSVDFQWNIRCYIP
jgi:hypothetical protein